MNINNNNNNKKAVSHSFKKWEPLTLQAKSLIVEHPTDVSNVIKSAVVADLLLLNIVN